MRVIITGIALVWMMLLGACGGGALNAVEGDNLPAQPEITAPEQPEAESAANEPVVPNPDPTIGSEPPVGAAVVGLTRGTMDTVPLPAMDPSVLVPEDTKLPTLWLFNFSQGATLHDTANLSVLSVDDSDTNLIALLIDRELVKVSESAVLELEWDTLQLADGDHELIFVVRDNGNNMGLCALSVEVDNARLWCPPELKVDSIRSTFDGVEFYEDCRYQYNLVRWRVGGMVDLEIVADCAAGIKQIELYTLGAYSTGWEDSELVGRAENGNFSVTLDSFAWSENELTKVNYSTGSWYSRDFRAIAEDHAGNRTQMNFRLLPRRTADVSIYFEGELDESHDLVYCYLMPQDWEATGEIDLDDAVQYGPPYGRWIPTFYDVPIGRHVMVAAHGEETRMIPFVCNPTNMNRVNSDFKIFE